MSHLKKVKKLIPVLLVFFFVKNLTAQVVINEIMSNNQSTILDDNGKYSDWIEFYNPTGSPVDIDGYYLSDNADSLRKWEFPPFVIPAFGFRTVWCSGLDDLIGANIHTNFSIDVQGENIYFSDQSGNVIDNVSSVPLPADKSYGRFPDGGSFNFLSEPSYHATNNAAATISGLIPDAPEFSVPGGFYTTDQNITLTHTDPTVTIHYTLDGSDPTEFSPVYSTPINVHSRVGEPNYYSMIRTCYNVHFFLPDWTAPPLEVFKCSIVRARAFKTGFFPGPIKTFSYFIDPNMFSRYGNLPVVSLVSDPKNLFNDTTGIYVPGINYQPSTFHANYYLDWDKPANIEMYMPGGVAAFNGNFKISINGQSSPSSPQKGINVTASTDYGPAKIDYPLFENTNGPAKYINKFDKIKLRAWGSDRKETLFRDAFCATMMERSGLDIEAYRPCVVFIDGEYWGLQEMRERNRNGEYLQSHYLIDAKNPGFDILDGAGNTVIEGNSAHWDAMVGFMNSNSMGVQPNYDYIKTQLDVNSFMLSYMSSIYFARGDWPDQNEAKWRAEIPGSKWRWLQWDMDNTTGYYLNPWYDMFNLVLNGSRGYGPSDILSQLLVNQGFRNDFINLFADYINTEYLPGITTFRVNATKDELAPDYPEMRDRWQTNYNWYAKISDMITWLNQRPQFVQQQLVSTFALNGMFNMTMDVSDSMKGFVKVNTIKLDRNTTRLTQLTYPWTGVYFNGVPIPVIAKALPGYKFIEWLPTHDTAQTMYVNLYQDTTITAVFDIDPNYIPVVQPVINEAMSANDSTIADNYGEYDDWLEIFNPGSDTIDLAGYYLTDNMILPTRFLFKGGTDSTKIPPQGHLLVWIDNDTEEGILHTNFKFNSNGDFVALIEPDGETVADSISFGHLNDDVSVGRSYDGGPVYILFQVSTPGATNEVIGNEYIAINEIQTVNVSTIADNYGQYDQWVELYNPSLDTVDLAGWKISNDPNNSIVYTFPHGNDSTKIAPGGFMLLWADQESSQGLLHMNFTLQSQGCLTLYKSNFAFTDSVCYTTMNGDESYGRISDGNIQWMHFAIPTPDSNNVDLTTVDENINSRIENFAVFPNPVKDNNLYLTKPATFDITDVLGRKLLYIRNSNYCDISSLESGMYFVTLKSEFSIPFIKQ
jgi:hypothetical protein